MGTAQAEKKLYGPNRLIVVGSVTSPGENGAVGIRYGEVGFGEPVRYLVAEGFTTETLQPGDYAMKTDPAADVGVITTVFRRGKEVFSNVPPPPTHGWQAQDEPNLLVQIRDVTLSRRDLRIGYGQVDGSGFVSSLVIPRITVPQLEPGDHAVMATRRSGTEFSSLFRESFQIYPPHLDPSMQATVLGVANRIRSQRAVPQG